MVAFAGFKATEESGVALVADFGATDALVEDDGGLQVLRCLARYWHSSSSSSGSGSGSSSSDSTLTLRIGAPVAERFGASNHEVRDAWTKTGWMYR